LIRDLRTLIGNFEKSLTQKNET